MRGIPLLSIVDLDDANLFSALVTPTNIALLRVTCQFLAKGSWCEVFSYHRDYVCYSRLWLVDAPGNLSFCEPDTTLWWCVQFSAPGSGMWYSGAFSTWERCDASNGQMGGRRNVFG